MASIKSFSLLFVASVSMAAAQLIVSNCDPVEKPDNGYPLVEVKAVNATLTMPYDYDIITGGLTSDVGILNFREIFLDGMNFTLGIAKERLVMRRIRRAMWKVRFQAGDLKMQIDWDRQGLVTEVQTESWADMKGVKVGMRCYKLIDLTQDDLEYPCLETNLALVNLNKQSFDILFSTAKDESNQKKLGTTIEFTIVDPPIRMGKPVKGAKEAADRLAALLEGRTRGAWKAPFNKYIMNSQVELAMANYGCDFTGVDASTGLPAVPLPQLWLHEGQFDGTAPKTVEEVNPLWRAPSDCGGICDSVMFEGVEIMAGCADHLLLSPGEDHRTTPWCMVQFDCRGSTPGFGGRWVLCEKAPPITPLKISTSGASRQSAVLVLILAAIFMPVFGHVVRRP